VRKAESPERSRRAEERERLKVKSEKGKSKKAEGRNLKNLKNLKNLINFIILLFLLSSCGSENKNLSSQDKQKPISDSLTNFNLTENQKRVLDGAKKCLEDGFKYDNEMAYCVLEYRDGSYIGGAVYPNGDIAPNLGVCTEVTIRALRYAGITDLQEAIHNDLKSSWNDYPMKRWNAKNPDANIDHRRVPNQLVWFKKYWKSLDNSDWQPGDVVVWDMNNDGWADHIGIVSDKSAGGTMYVIHNFPSPGYVSEEDVLNRWSVAGHFRVD
jgi:uncharacterized protein YijF (DUF1287 family)